MKSTGTTAQQSGLRTDERISDKEPAFTREAQILAQKLAMTYRLLPGALSAGVGGAFLLAFGLYRGTPPKVALLWLFAFCIVSFASWCICYWYKRSAPSPGENDVWAVRHIIAVFAIGLAWGTAGIVLFDNDNFRQLMLAFALLILSLSGITGGSIYLPVVVAFNTPTLAPIIVRIALVGDADHYLIAAGMSLMYCLTLYYARLLNKLTTRSIAIRFDNLELSEALTEQRVRERTRVLEIANQHKSEFLANMSHELRTPLNSVIGFSEVLKDGVFGEMNDKQTEYVQDIHTSGHHLLSLINDILDLSKIEAGRMELSVNAFDFPTAIKNSVMLVHERAGRHRLNLNVSIDPRLGSFIGDERKFKQILLNLLSNAIKFTPEGGSIFAVAVPTPAGVQVSVSDTGVGIAPEHHEEVFLAFHQVGDVAKKRQGTGLGLTLVKQFVELHGGRIWLESAPQQGSTFTFTLVEQHGERTDTNY